jgi:hypothetical protein
MPKTIRRRQLSSIVALCFLAVFAAIAKAGTPIASKGCGGTPRSPARVAVGLHLWHRENPRHELSKSVISSGSIVSTFRPASTRLFLRH